MWGSGLFPGGLGAGGASGGEPPLQGLAAFLTDLRLEFGHELVEVLTPADDLPALVDRVYLRTAALWSHDLTDNSLSTSSD